LNNLNLPGKPEPGKGKQMQNKQPEKTTTAVFTTAGHIGFHLQALK
jgi:hypothetical protein